MARTGARSPCETVTTSIRSSESRGTRKADRTTKMMMTTRRCQRRWSLAAPRGSVQALRPQRSRRCRTWRRRNASCRSLRPRWARPRPQSRPRPRSSSRQQARAHPLPKRRRRRPRRCRAHNGGGNCRRFGRRRRGGGRAGGHDLDGAAARATFASYDAAADAEAQRKRQTDAPSVIPETPTEPQVDADIAQEELILRDPTKQKYVVVRASQRRHQRHKAADPLYTPFPISHGHYAKSKSTKKGGFIDELINEQATKVLATIAIVQTKWEGDTEDDISLVAGYFASSCKRRTRCPRSSSTTLCARCRRCRRRGSTCRWRSAT